MNRWNTAARAVALTCVVWMAFTASGCATGDGDVSPTVARVGDNELTVADLDGMLVGTAVGEATAEAKWRAVERWVERELLYREGVRRGIDARGDVKRQIEIATRELVINALLQDRFAQQLAVTEQEVEQYYSEHRSLFRRSETTVWVKQIVVENRGEARRIQRQVTTNPALFESIAREVSTDPSGADGGDVGYLSESTAFNDEIWSAIMGLTENQISPVLRSESGYHIFKIMDRRATGDVMTLDEVRSDIITRVRSSKRVALITQLVEQLKLNEPYTIYQDQVRSQ